MNRAACKRGPHLPPPATRLRSRSCLLLPVRLTSPPLSSLLPLPFLLSSPPSPPCHSFLPSAHSKRSLSSPPPPPGLPCTSSTTPGLTPAASQHPCTFPTPLHLPNKPRPLTPAPSQHRPPHRCAGDVHLAPLCQRLWQVLRLLGKLHHPSLKHRQLGALSQRIADGKPHLQQGTTGICSVRLVQQNVYTG